MDHGFSYFKLKSCLRPSRDFYNLPTHKSCSTVDCKRPFTRHEEKAFALFPLPPAEKKRGLRWTLLVPELLPT